MRKYCKKAIKRLLQAIMLDQKMLWMQHVLFVVINGRENLTVSTHNSSDAVPTIFHETAHRAGFRMQTDTNAVGVREKFFFIILQPPAYCPVPHTRLPACH